MDYCDIPGFEPCGQASSKTEGHMNSDRSKYRISLPFLMLYSSQNGHISYSFTDIWNL